MRRFLRLFAALALLVLAFPLLLRTVDLRGDIADFLPAPDSEEAAFLLRELRSGAGTTLILAGVEGAAPEELARVSRDMAARLQASGLFTTLANGSALVGEDEAALLFAHRYALSPAVTPGAFTEPALRGSLEGLLDGLRSSAAPLVRRYGFADPTGAFLALVRGWTGDARVAIAHGVWMADGPRALLLAQSRAAGLDTEAQSRAVEAFRAAFAAASPPPGTRLLQADIARLLADPGIVRSRAKIEATIAGARIYNAMQDRGEDFARFCWSFTDGEPVRGDGVSSVTPLSETVSKDLKRRGFKFVGPTIVHAWMQAVGIVHDHAPGCFLRRDGA